MRFVFKYLRYLSVLMCLFSCSREAVPSITVDTENLQFDHEAASASILLTADMPWKATSSASWCRAVPESGTSTVRPVKIMILCDGNMTDDTRSVVLSFDIEGCSASLVIFQDCDDIVISSTEIEISSDGQIIEVPVSHKDGYSFEIEDCDDGWLREIATKSMNHATLVFEACENISAARSCRIIVSGGDAREEIIVMQKASDIEIPDPDLRECCMTLDTNGDGCLSKDEVSNVKDLSIFSSWVRSWDGLENFTELEHLSLSLGDFAPIPDFKVFHHLRDLSINGRQRSFDSFDLSTTGQLQNVTITDLSTNSLDLSGNKHLKELDFNLSSKSINLYGCDSLKVFKCSNNHSVKSLDLSENPMVTSLVINNCMSLQQVTLGDKPLLTDLNCSDNNVLSELNITDGSNIGTITCYRCHLDRLDLEACPVLSILNCRDNNLSELNISNSRGLTYLDCSYNKLSLLDIKNNRNLIELYANNNRLDQILAESSSLASLHIGHNRFNSFDLSPYVNLDTFQCSDNLLHELDCNSCPSLKKISCDGCKLKELMIDKCTSLESVSCTNNEMESLNLCGLLKLNYVAARNNWPDMVFYFFEGQTFPSYFGHDNSAQIIYKPV